MSITSAIFVDVILSKTNAVWLGREFEKEGPSPEQ